jgi:tetratricopeptide (TPR) repeat protein
MKKSSIITFALLIFTFSLSIFAQDDARVAAGWRVLKYDINANLPSNPADRNLSARATLNLQNIGTGAGSRLTLRIHEKAEVTSVTINNSNATFNKIADEKLGARPVQRFVVNVPNVQPNANITVTVNYNLKIEENSGLNAISPVSSQFLPLSFWYPTPNSHFASRGADFAPFSLAVNGVGGATVLSTGKASGASFNQTLNGQPFFVVGNWDAVESNGISVYLPKGASADERKRAEEIAALTNAARTYISGLLGNFPDAPLKIVAVRRGAGYSDSGMILMDYGLFRRPKIDSQTAMRISEAIAKTYLGNVSQIRGEGLGVIREGFSRFIATQFIEKQYGKESADIERLRQRAAYAAVARRDSPLSIASPADDFYFVTVANKGAMVWRMLAEAVGEQQLFNAVRNQAQQGSLNLANLRTEFSSQKPFLDYVFDQPTDMNLLAGLPQASGGETKVALRNLGSYDATVNVVATTDRGEKLTTQVTIPAKSFGEAIFRTASKVVRAEVDPEKLYPQTDFSDDIAPRDFTESDSILVIKRAYDKRDFAAAEKSARTALRATPNFDEARMWLGRALLAQGKNQEAEREFRAVLDAKLPAAQSLAWATVGLGEIALKANQPTQAANYFNEVIRAEAEAGAVFNARLGRNNSRVQSATEETVRTFFQQLDKAATSGRRAELDALILPGEMPRFSSGIGGQAQQWQTALLHIDRLDENNVLAEVGLNIKMLNKDPESGTAIFQLTRVGGAWKLSGIEMFEVR